MSKKLTSVGDFVLEVFLLRFSSNIFHNMLKSLLKKIVLLTFGPPVRFVISQMGIHDQVNKKMESLEQLVQDIYPDEWILNEDVLAEVDRVKGIFNLPETVDMGISKNDLMLRNFLNNGFSVKASVRAYLVRGIGLMDSIQKVAERKWGQHWANEIGPFLDFASGYGTLERVMVHYVDPKLIYTSDIKVQGVDYQVTKFGVNGIYSSYVPEEFKPTVKFKLIFVGSLFSHLPSSLFLRWLKQLWEILDTEGNLVFTVHDTSLINSSEDFVYSDISEDSSMNIVADSIQKKDSYGTAYVSEKYMKTCFQTLGLTDQNYCRYERISGGTQDIYILSRDIDKFKNIKFNLYDSEAI